MSWKYVFNSNLLAPNWMGIEQANKYAKDCGYEFFVWNGDVYHVNGNKSKISIKDLF